jgi:hypothetical protein
MTGMRARGKRLWRVVLVLALATFALVTWWAWWATPYVNSAALLMDMTGAAPGVRRWLPVRVLEVSTRDLIVPTRHGDVPARLYRATPSAGPTLVIFPVCTAVAWMSLGSSRCRGALRRPARPF